MLYTREHTKKSQKQKKIECEKNLLNCKTKKKQKRNKYENVKRQKVNCEHFSDEDECLWFVVVSHEKKTIFIILLRIQHAQIVSTFEFNNILTKQLINCTYLIVLVAIQASVHRSPIE